MGVTWKSNAGMTRTSRVSYTRRLPGPKSPFPDTNTATTANSGSLPAIHTARCAHGDTRHHRHRIINSASNRNLIPLRLAERKKIPRKTRNGCWKVSTRAVTEASLQQQQLQTSIYLCSDHNLFFNYHVLLLLNSSGHRHSA